MLTTQLYSALCGYFPEADRCAWDNDGISVLPSFDHESKKILLALDLTNPVCEYAKEHGFDTVITHHPLNFRPFSALDLSTPASAKAVMLARKGIAAMAFHTRFDRADGGVNTVMADKLGIEGKRFGPSGEEIGIAGSIKPVSFDDFADRVKKIYGTEHYCCEKCTDVISTVAVCGGAAGEMISAAIDAQADVLVCGELKYHEMLDAADSGLSVICVGHYESEYPAMARFDEILSSLGDFYTEIY